MSIGGTYMVGPTLWTARTECDVIANAFRGAAIGLIVMCCSANADELVRYSGRCHSLTTFDRLVARQCQDKIVVQTADRGERGFLAMMDDGGAVFFIVADRGVGRDNIRIMPVARVEFGYRDQAEPLPTINGICKADEPTGYRFAIECEAMTGRGRFALKFTADAETAERLQP